MTLLGSARDRREARAALLFLLPNLLGFLLFTAGPVAFCLAISFSNWNLQRTVPFQWIGLENYARLLSDPEFWLYTVNTVYLMAGMPVAIAGSLVLALLLSQRLRGITAYRTLFYLPSFTSGIALIILWKALYNPDFGPINYGLDWLIEALRVNHALASLGFQPVSPPEWLQSTHNLAALPVERVGFDPSQFGLGARDAIVIMGVWTAVGGNNMLLFLAGISNIPTELHEAAAIDGASRWEAFRHVTWPQLAPTTFFVTVMSIIGGLQGGFEQARVLTQGGPAGTTTTLAYHIYVKAFEEFQVGYAASISWILFALIFAMTLANWRFGNREVTY